MYQESNICCICSETPCVLLAPLIKHLKRHQAQEMLCGRSYIIMQTKKLLKEDVFKHTQTVFINHLNEF